MHFVSTMRSIVSSERRGFYFEAVLLCVRQRLFFSVLFVKIHSVQVREQPVLITTHVHIPATRHTNIPRPIPHPMAPIYAAD